MMRLIRSRFTSGTVDDVNFYFEADHFGVSDNHRMAYWFFCRNASLGSSLIHVDTHVDRSCFFDSDRVQLRETHALASVDQFVEHRYQRNGNEMPPVRDGNWIPALIKMHPCLFDKILLICRRPAGPQVLTDLPCAEEADEVRLWSPNVLTEPGVCLSIDVDYYFAARDKTYSLRESRPEPVVHFQQLLRHGHSHAHVPLFVALSPDYCGGWHNVLPFVNCIDRTFGLSLGQEIQRRLEPGEMRMEDHQ